MFFSVFRLKSPSPISTVHAASLVLFLVAAIVCVAAQVAVIRDVVLGRAPGTSRQFSGRWAEMAWAVLPAVALVIVLVMTWHAIAAGRHVTANVDIRGV